MGAINYGNGNIINLGYDLRHVDYNNYEEEEFYFDELYQDVERLLDKEYFEYYDISLENGYYDGFYLKVDFKYLWLDDYASKLEALKEATRLGNLLRTLIKDYSMVSYSAGWITHYYDKETSLKMVKNAIKGEKDMIKGLYTEKTLTLDKWKELVGIGGR